MDLIFLDFFYGDRIEGGFYKPTISRGILKKKTVLLLYLALFFENLSTLDSEVTGGTRVEVKCERCFEM